MSSPDDHAPDGVTTGVLAAEHRAAAQLARRRRLLVGGAVLGLVIAGAVVATLTVLQARANNEAQRAAERAAARASFAAAVVAQAEDYQPVASAVQADATGLQRTLEQLLAETDRSDDDLATAATDAAGELEAALEQVRGLTGRDLPVPPDLVDPDRALTVLRELETLRVEAGALLDEVPVAVADAERWRTAVLDVNRTLAAHVAQVEAEEATSDPAALVELWQAERPSLEELAAAATTASEVPGLEAWGSAHRAYAEDVLGWIDEAVPLLEDGELDTYNQRFDELFDGADPFGFNAAVAAATQEALASAALLEVAELGQRAQLVLDAIVATEATVAAELGGDVPSPAP